MIYHIFYNNDIDGSEPQLLYRKIGENVEFSTDFSNFYNMNIISRPPFIVKSSRGGKRRKTKRNTRKNIHKKTKRNRKRSRY